MKFGWTILRACHLYITINNHLRCSRPATLVSFDIYKITRSCGGAEGGGEWFPVILTTIILAIFAFATLLPLINPLILTTLLLTPLLLPTLTTPLTTTLLLTTLTPLLLNTLLFTTLLLITLPLNTLLLITTLLITILIATIFILMILPGILLLLLLLRNCQFWHGLDIRTTLTCRTGKNAWSRCNHCR